MSDKERGRPAGPFSIGRALDIPVGPVNDDLRRAVDAIDRMHGAGLLPRIPMSFAGKLGAPGRFFYNPVTGEPIRIFIDLDAPRPTLVALHEIGHFLDVAAFGSGSQFGSLVNPLMTDWLTEITASSAYLKLSEQQASTPSDQLFIRLQVEELWARSYAQYIAIRYGELPLLHALDAVRTTAQRGLHIPLQWHDNDFDGIAAAIDALFSKLGWRR
jgi:hypothetical protein